MMKAQGVYLSKGVAKTVEIKVPKTKANEVLIETKACGICMGDIYLYQGNLPSKGGVFGHEGAGIVADVGSEVKNIQVGDKVTALGGPAFAQYYTTNCRNVAKIPADMEDFAPWISEPVACVVNGIRGAGIEIGDNVCIIGCGYMGLLLIQAMPRTYLNRLVAIDIKEDRLKLAKQFGAEILLNPKNVDSAKEAKKLFGGEADVVVEASGALGTLGLATELVKPGSKLVIFGRHVIDEKVPTEVWHTKGLKVLNTAPHSSLDFIEDFCDAVNLLRKGVFNQNALITHRFPYTQAEKAFKTASEKPEGYVKGVLTF
jgi:threonine dehydrogenase-like Zn-dependent dehydrogenase